MSPQHPSGAGWPMRLGYLGPVGTFSEEAAGAFAPDADLVPLPTFVALLDGVAAGTIDAAMLPVENSQEGAVSAALDALAAAERVRVRAEFACPVILHLIGATHLRLEDVRRVVSHPQPLGQARSWMRAHLRADVELVEAPSTAAAVRDLASFGPAETTAAIGAEAAARLYDRRVIARGVQGDAVNVTRFLVPAAEDAAPTGRDKTTVAFGVPNAPGALVAALTAFSERGVNLTRIESRPSKRALGEYMFHADLEGHRLDPPVRAALDEVGRRSSWLRVVGSYPSRGAPV